MQNKKKLIPLLLLPVLMLTACDDIMAKPTNYSDPLVVNSDGTKLASGVVNNVNSVIQNAKWKDGSASTKVLDETLRIIAASIIGSFTATADDPISLIEAYDKAVIALKPETFTPDTVVDRFLDYHSTYWEKDPTTSVRKTDEKSHKREYKKIVKMYDRIKKSIATKMYDKISVGTYNYEGKFYETKFLMSLFNSCAKVVSPITATQAYNGVIIDPEVPAEEVFSHYLHQEYYHDVANGITYVVDEVVPTIYKEILTEQYVFDESYPDIGRSYARKVNVISVSTNDNHPLVAGKLMKAFAAKYINCDQTPAAPSTTFKYLSAAARGLSTSQYWTQAQELLEASTTYNQQTLTEKILGGNIDVKYYEGTSYGDLCEKVMKVKDNNKVTDSSIESEFTSNNHSVKTGFELKTTDISSEKFIQTGWFTKANGLSDLPDSIRTRLFNIGVSNALDNKNTEDRFNGTTYKVPDNEKYVAKIHGSYYLIPAVTERQVGEERLEDFIWYDSSTKKYYIVNIEEAVSSSKLSLTAIDDNYEGLYPEEDKGWNKMQDFAHEIADKITESSTYETQSTKYWLKYASITYHDDKIYEYFKTNYPELF